MGLPILDYYEKKYPGSYKYWLIQKKCSQCAPLYFNHPLIDRIKITDEWGEFGDYDKKLMAECDVRTRPSTTGFKHSSPDWYNYVSGVRETAYMAGIPDLEDVLTEEEMKPKLYKWFNTGFHKATSTYAHKAVTDTVYKNNIAIWPFAGSPGRSPTPQWWKKLIDNLIHRGYTVHHYGMPQDPLLSNLKGYRTFPSLSYFEQVKASLASELTIGTDSGAMWVIGAYSHPAIHLMTNWLPDHKSNLLAFEPVNDNGQTFFEMGGCDNISVKEVLNNILERVSL